ncbi:hypothetical protein ACWCXH_16095 [Kitasatospora sp. NPDC001660]
MPKHQDSADNRTAPRPRALAAAAVLLAAVGAAALAGVSVAPAHATVAPRAAAADDLAWG